MEPNLNGSLEILKDRLLFASLRGCPQDTPKYHFFCTDQELIYEPFYADFGPLNLGCTFKFCQILNAKMNDKDLSNKVIVYYSGLDPQRRSCSAALIGIYCVYYLRFTPEEACKIFANAYPPLLAFRDASYGACTYQLTVQDVIRGMYKGLIHQFVDFATFDYDEYNFYEKVENGDLNELIPGKFLAFSGPSAVRTEIGDGLYTLSPEDYHSIFRKKGITTIVRLNKKVYDRRQFTCAGFKHYDMYFMDGGTPTEAICRRFIEVAETEPGGLAVHCKAGLGRTGTLIGCYMMKHYRFQSGELIGYLRVCRPGTIIGPQQYYLKEMEQRMWRLGEACRKKKLASSLDSTLLGIAPPMADDDEASELAASVKGMDLEGNRSPVRSTTKTLPSTAGRNTRSVPNLVASPLRASTAGGGLFDSKRSNVATPTRSGSTAVVAKRTTVSSSVLPQQYAPGPIDKYYELSSGDAGPRSLSDTTSISSFTKPVGAKNLVSQTVAPFPIRPRFTRGT